MSNNKGAQVVENPSSTLPLGRPLLSSHCSTMYCLCQGRVDACTRACMHARARASARSSVPFGAESISVVMLSYNIQLSVYLHWD
jgi:hypothetical protein